MPSCVGDFPAEPSSMSSPSKERLQKHLRTRDRTTNTAKAVWTASAIARSGPIAAVTATMPASSVLTRAMASTFKINQVVHFISQRPISVHGGRTNCCSEDAMSDYRLSFA